MISLIKIGFSLCAMILGLELYSRLMLTLLQYNLF